MSSNSGINTTPNFMFLIGYRPAYFEKAQKEILFIFLKNKSSTRKVLNCEPRPYRLFTEIEGAWRLQAGMGAWRLQDETEGAWRHQAGTEKAQLLQVVRD